MKKTNNTPEIESRHALIARIPLKLVRMPQDARLEGFEGYTLVWSQDYLKVYKQTHA